MKYSIQSFLDAAKAKELPVAEHVAIDLIDTWLADLKVQCAAQPGDVVATVVGFLDDSVKPSIDAGLAKTMPDAAKA